MKLSEKIFEYKKNLKTIDSNQSLDNDDFNYCIEPKYTKLYNNKEIYTVDENRKYWMGEYARKKIENRKSEESTYIGDVENRDGLNKINLNNEDLFGNTALFGQTGYGKSTLMNNIMLQWVNKGYGLCYINPKENDAQEFIRKVPSNRMDDVVYINIGSKNEKRIMINLFDPTASKEEDGYEQEVEYLTNTFVQILRDRLDIWNNRIEYILETLTRKLIRDEDKVLLRDIPPFLSDKEQMQEFVKNYDDIENTFTKVLSTIGDTKRSSICKIINNMRDNRPIKQLSKSGNTSFDIGELAKNGKILIIDTCYFYSESNRQSALQLLISKISSSLKTKYQDIKNPFCLCVDNFELVSSRNFNLDRITSKSENSKLSVIVSAQQPSQLSCDVKDSLEQFSSILTFNIGPNPRDQQEISQMFRGFNSWKLADLESHKALCNLNNKNQKEPSLIIAPPEYPPLRSFEDCLRSMNLDDHRILPDNV